MTTPFLIGQTTYLRPLERSDAALAQAWLSDPEVRSYLRRQRTLSLQAEEEHIARIAQSEQDIA